MQAGWQENDIYPGKHWLFYNRRGHYLARVDFQDWTHGLYMWRLMQGWLKDDVVGWETTLEKAQSQAEKVLAGESCQLNLPLEYRHEWSL